MSLLRRAAPLALLLMWAAPAWAEELPQPPPRSFGATFLYWFGAVVLMLFVAQRLFREHLNEHRTLRLLMNEVGPFFPEFDIEAVVKWVHLAAPHVWAGWEAGGYHSLADFGTPALHEAGRASGAEDARLDQRREARLQKVLKVHPLGLYLVGEGPPPADVELMLRLEQRGVLVVRGPDGAVVSGAASARQVQHFWWLRHDGHRWRLHAVEPAEDDVTDLAQRPPLPPLMEWRRPRGAGSEG